MGFPFPIHPSRPHALNSAALPPQVLEQEGRYSRNWLLAADVDKSPVPMHRRGQQLHQ